MILFLYSLGEIPSCDLNHLLKCCENWKPNTSEMCEMELLDIANNSFAFSKALRWMCFKAEMPVSLRMRSLK